MRSLSISLVLIAASSAAHADDVIVAANETIDLSTQSKPADEPARIEAGLFGGGFVSNKNHQFYDFDLFPGQPGDPTLPVREELTAVSPLMGARFAMFLLPWFGVEGELSLILAKTKDSEKSANIYGGRLQLIFQAPNLSKLVVPYVALGDGFDHVSSPEDTLGSDTDWAPHVGAGVRLLVHRSITLRVDGRYLRAPSIQAPYHVNAGLGEVMLGISWRPSKAPPAPPPPPPETAIDSDGDGVVDANDKCRGELEDKDLFDDTDGCPDPDNDADGLADGTDQCPLDAEDKDGYEDDDGCVDTDNDADGVVDAQDKCVNEPEDRDSHRDADGCPDLDNDSDGFSDAQDRCPNEPEMINGVDDEDGCPDKGNSLVVLSPDRLELIESIVFKKTVLQKESFPLLQQLGATLRAHPEILRLRITVYVNPSKKPDDDKQLSEARAFAIREWLIKYGIADKRLDPRGFGGQSPLVDPKTKNAAAINDRVDLIILERK